MTTGGTSAAGALRRAVCLTVLICLLLPSATVSAGQPFRVTLDAGHGGGAVGASHRFADGLVLREDTLNLRVARRARELLQQRGFVVTLTRSTDAAVEMTGHSLRGRAQSSLVDELQARVDAANRASSDVLVSIHFNGSSDRTVRGTETFWNANRPFSERSRQLAERIQTALVTDLRAAGYVTRDRGAQTDGSLLNGDSFFLLGPRSNVIARASEMPAVISEPLFLTNQADATALRDDRIVEAVARGYVDGIRAYAASHGRASGQSARLLAGKRGG